MSNKATDLLRTTSLFPLLGVIVMALLCRSSLIAVDVLEAAERTTHVVALKDADTVAAEFRIGTHNKIQIDLRFADGTTKTLRGKVGDDVQIEVSTATGKPTGVKIPQPDSKVTFTGPPLTFTVHSRPHLIRYTEAQQADLAARWDTFPAASQRFHAIEIRDARTGTQVWMDDRFAGQLAASARLDAVAFTVEAGGSLRAAQAYVRPHHGRFLPLDVAAIARPGVMRSAQVTPLPGPQQINDVPLIMVAGSQSAEVAAAKEMQGLRYLETDQYTSRTSLDGMPESLHFSVPQAFYRRAWVVCAVDPDPAKDPVLTTRLTRFGVSGRGGAIADTTLTLPRGNEPLPNGITKIGDVTYPSVNGTTVTVPLLLVAVDLHLGAILDLLADESDRFAAMKIGPYLDLEFLGKRDHLYVQTSREHKPARDSTSAVQLFAATLEEAPAELRLKQAQHGNIFHNHETPETTALIRATTPGQQVLAWEISDVDGRLVRKQETIVDLTTAGSEQEIRLPLAMPDLGWYRLRITVAQPGEAPYLSHDAAFALLGQDTRKAGIESPFGTWWFGGAHYSARDLTVVGPLLQKAGLRRIPVGWTDDAQTDLAPWQLTLNQQRWRFRVADLDDWDAATKRVEAYTREMIKRFPDCQYVDIFHESFANKPTPPELFGQPPAALTPEQELKEARVFELGLRAARFYRERFPQFKLVVGNSGGSSTLIAMLLRRGFPRDYIDYLGSETTGQTIAPEKMSPHTTNGIWLMRATARHFFPGQPDIPLTGCYEYTARPERDLGGQRAAEWYTRDILIPLAYRFPTVSPGLITDVGNAYHQTLWGSSGLCERNPLHYPKRAYVAMATLTKVLDQATLVRQVPTGSSSAHAFEFKRDGDYIYALWTPRGVCDMQVEVSGDATLEQVGFYGQRQTVRGVAGRLNIPASTAVTYLIAAQPVQAITAGKRTFPAHQPPTNAQVITAIASSEPWVQVPDDQSLVSINRRPGQFTMRDVIDDERGACVELQLEPQGKLPALVGEYTLLRLRQPLTITGRPHSVGMWVKGDSSWGRVLWEVEDAKGERWISTIDSRDEEDWANQATIDFEGWCFLTYPLTDRSPFCHLEPNAGLGQWTASGGDKRLDYPLKLVGIGVISHRASVNLTEMQPVTGTIRLQNVCAMGEER